MQRTNCGVMLAVAIIATATFPSAAAKACGPVANLQAQARLAMSPNKEQAQSAITALRAAGPAGLNVLVQEYRPLIEKHDGQPDWPRVKAAIDAVGGQYDCYTSKLYWYTDWDAAQVAATKTGKPILELRCSANLPMN